MYIIIQCILSVEFFSVKINGIWSFKNYVVKSSSIGKTTWFDDEIFLLVRKNFRKNFFCLKSPETQSKSKKLKEFNIFFEKTKIFPLKLKNTCKIFMSQGLDKACLVQRFLAQALNLCSGLLVSSLVSLHLGLKNKSKQREILLLATLWISKMRFTWSKEICYHKAIFSKQFRVA